MMPLSANSGGQMPHDARVTPLDQEDPPAGDRPSTPQPALAPLTMEDSLVYVRTPLGQRYSVPRAALAYSPFLSMQQDFAPLLQEVDVTALLDSSAHTLAAMPDHFYPRLCSFLRLYAMDQGRMPAIPARFTMLPAGTVFRRHRYWPVVADLTLLEVGLFDRFALFMGLDDLRRLNEARVAVLLQEHRASLHYYLPYFLPFIERDVQLQRMRATPGRRASPRLSRHPEQTTG